MTALAIGLGLTGCGGSSGLSGETVEERVGDELRAQLPAGAAVDQPECVQDGNDSRWRCVTYAINGDVRYQATLSVTCDVEADRCLSEPVNLIRLP